MTKKDYLRAAEVIRTELWVRNDDERELLVGTFIDFFQGDNPRFNEERFRKACQNENS